MTIPTPNILLVDSNDNVLVATQDVKQDLHLFEHNITVKQDIPKTHKIAKEPVKQGQPIRKCDHVIGIASADIAAGVHIHTHNMQQPDAICSESIITNKTNIPIPTQHSFKGYLCADGRAGTRNYIGVLATVNCSATVSKLIAEAFRSHDALADYQNIDGVVAFVHSSGCAMDMGGEGYQTLQRVMRGYMQHPNIGGVLYNRSRL